MTKGKVMNPETVPVGELIYEAEIQFTDIVEYGVSIKALSSGKTPPPPEGARFDQSFQGTINGPRLSGRISGTDYLYVRADGCFRLHIHAQIKTDDGHNISFSSEGVSIQNEGTKETQLRAAVSLFTSSPEYSWLNRLQVWAMGPLYLEKGEAFVRAYAA
jgi:hypothetical protein